MILVDSLKIDKVKSSILSAKATWTASENKFTRMSATTRSLLLGYVPGPQDLSLEEAENVAKANFAAFVKKRAVTVTYPVSCDLRNMNGKHYITSIKNQGICLSCVAFGTIATVEGAARKLLENPFLDIDLSEAHLFFCYGKTEGTSCFHGWRPEPALDFLCAKGVVDESCYPYNLIHQNGSNLCADWQNRLTKITGWQTLSSMDEMKSWISTKGPLVATYTVYLDFLFYRSGIYKHVVGTSLGGHCVSCVGYDDGEGYWICKNSWGPLFGEDGFFKIAYGECGIDAKMWAIKGIQQKVQNSIMRERSR